MKRFTAGELKHRGEVLSLFRLKLPSVAAPTRPRLSHQRTAQRSNGRANQGQHQNRLDDPERGYLGAQDLEEGDAREGAPTDQCAEVRTAEEWRGHEQRVPRWVRGRKPDYGGRLIQFEERGFEAAERRALSSELTELRRLKRRFDLFIFGSFFAILIVGLPLALGQARNDPGLGALAFGTVAVYGLIVLYVYFREGGGHRARLRTLSGATDDGGIVRVTRCRAERVVAAEEMEDEGPEYFFEVEPGRTYYVGGQHFEGEPGFPSTDFEIVEGFDGHGGPVLFEIRCHGRPLEPVRTIPVATKLEMLSSGRYPEDGDLLDCSLGEIEATILGDAERDA